MHKVDVNHSNTRILVEEREKKERAELKANLIFIFKSTSDFTFRE